MNEQIATTINKINKVFIPHDKVVNAISKLEKSLLLSQAAQNQKDDTLTSFVPDNILLLGEAGTGKTTVCSAIIQKYPAKVMVDEGFETTIVPSFYTQVPSPITIKGVASSVLKSLGAHDHDKGSIPSMTKKIDTLLRTCKTDLMMLDEFHHLLNDRTDAAKVRNWIKALINESKVPIVLVGEPGCEALIDSDLQLKRRFPVRINLDKLDFYSNGGAGEFIHFSQSVSVAITKVCKLVSFPKMNTEKELYPLYVATGGYPSSMLTLLKEAVYLALKRGENSVSMEDISQAYDSVTLAHSLVSKGNPFQMKLSELIKSIK